jgi:EAL domain-containing protein (putative c-di-GMP-specific phosphodiesterase class I)
MAAAEAQVQRRRMRARLLPREDEPFVTPTADRDYFELRTDWLRLKSHVYDALTALPSLPAVMEDLRRLLESQRNLEVLYADVGRSGWQESKLGWAAYDAVVKGFADVLAGLRDRRLLERRDIVCLHTVRSDRFLMFLGAGDRGTGAPARRQEVTMELRTALAQAPEGSALRSIRVAFGHARVSEHPLARAERSIQQAVSDAVLMSLTAREGVEAARHDELARMLAMEGVRTVFHPIVRISDRVPVGFEALTRAVRPSSFDSVEELFAFAESTDMIVDFERLCRKTALRTAMALDATGLLFLNASAQAILDPEWLSPPTDELLSAIGRSPREIVIEVTERMAVGRHATFPEALRRLKAAGYRVAVDDMGAGHASLQALASIEPDFLKFDVTLVRDIDKSSIKRSLLETLRGLADKMKAQVIAEGIEREEERATLASLGIELGQGFLFHREGSDEER